MAQALAERILGAERTHHLGYAPGEAKPAEEANHRSGSTPKPVVTDDDTVTLEIPRDSHRDISVFWPCETRRPAKARFLMRLLSLGGFRRGTHLRYFRTDR